MRAQILLGYTVAFQAPAHVQGHCLVHTLAIHPVHASVATGAADSARYMRAVIEVREVRQVVNTRPCDGHACFMAAADRFQQLTVRLDGRMAVHADFSAGQRGVGTGLDAGMAVAAIDAEVTGMDLVAVFNGLDGAVAGGLGGGSGCSQYQHDAVNQAADDQYTNQTGQTVNPWRKQLFLFTFHQFRIQHWNLTIRPS